MKLLKMQFLREKDLKISLMVMSYLFVFNLVPFLFMRTDSDVAFHARQGFIQMLIWLLIPYLLLLPLVGWVIGALLAVANLALMLSGIYYASSNKKVYVPLIGKFFEKIL